MRCAQKTRMGSSALGASTRDYVLFKKKTTGVNFDLVMGYKGSADILLAMERGEIDGICGWDWSSVKSQRSDWLRDGKLNLLVQVGLEPDAELTPARRSAAVELHPQRRRPQGDRADRHPAAVPAALYRAARRAGRAGRRSCAPPSTRPCGTRSSSTTRVKTRIDINPLSGAKVQELVEKIYATPKSVVDRAKEILKP